MTNEELRLLDELKNAHRQLERQRGKKRRRILLRLFVLLLLAALVAVPGASALYVAELPLLQPRGLDSVTNTALFDAFYPVGAIYQTTENVDPATLFGGSWTKVEAGRVLVGVGAGFAAGAKGGSVDGTAAVALTGTATGIGSGGTAVSLGGTVTAPTAATAVGGAGLATGIGGALTLNFTHTLTTAQMPSHFHSIPAHYHSVTHNHQYHGVVYTDGRPDGYGDRSPFDGNQYSYWWGTTNPATSSWGPGATGGASANTGNTGNGTAFTYTNTGTAANFTGNTVATIAANAWTGTASASGAISNLSGAATVNGGTLPDKTMQPYIVVYTWERVS